MGCYPDVLLWVDVCVSPKLMFPNAWCLDVGALGGDQVMRGISALMKENPRVP